MNHDTIALRSRFQIRKELFSVTSSAENIFLFVPSCRDMIKSAGIFNLAIPSWYYLLCSPLYDDISVIVEI